MNHDDANRALMGSNMQKQATPCIEPEAPFVATGIEGSAMRDTGRLLIALNDGTVSKVDGNMIEAVDGKNNRTLTDLLILPKPTEPPVFTKDP